MTAMAEQIDVSLNSEMKSLVTGGTTRRTACGTMIRRNAVSRLMPSDRAASICPLGIANKPAR